MAQTYRIGIIGAGTIAEQNHIPAYKSQPDASIVAVCDTVEDRARAVAERHGIANVFTSWEALVHGDTVDAVSIATPNAFHAPISIGAMHAGKHVFCEKPPAIDAAQAAEVCRVARETGQTYMACFNQRFFPEAQLLREMVARGELGEVYYARTGMIRRRGSSGGWFTRKELAGGGALMDIGVHMLDLARWMMGNPRPVAVMGMATQKIGSFQLREFQTYVPAEMRGVTHRDAGWAGDVDEMAVALIRFETGATLSLEVSWALNTCNERNYTEIYGTTAGATMNPLTVAGEEHGYLTDKIFAVPPISYEETHVRAIRHFLDCVRSGEEPLSSADQTVTTMRILNAIYESSETHQLVAL